MAEKRDSYKLSAEEEAILDLCIKVEEKCAALYRQFHASYRSVPHFSQLWETIAREEDGHAEAFRTAARLKGVGVESVSSEKADFALLRDVEHFLNATRVKKSSPAEALKFAIKLERDISEFHLVTIVNFNDETVEKAFKKAMEHDHEHIARLELALADLAT